MAYTPISDILTDHHISFFPPPNLHEKNVTCGPGPGLHGGHTSSIAPAIAGLERLAIEMTETTETHTAAHHEHLELSGKRMVFMAG